MKRNIVGVVFLVFYYSLVFITCYLLRYAIEDFKTYQFTSIGIAIFSNIVQFIVKPYFKNGH